MAYYQDNRSAYGAYYEVIFYDDLYYSAHFHPNLEFIYVTDGILTVYDEEKTLILGAGEAALILPNHIHAFNRQNGARCVICSFAEEYVPAFCEHLKGKSAQNRGFVPAPSLSAYLLHAFGRRETPGALGIKAIAYAVCAAFLAAVPLTEAPGTNGPLPRILSYITQNYTSNIRLCDLAAAIGYEEHYLSRRFHAYFSVNFRDYLNQLRVSRAKGALANGTESVTAIAYASGFSSVRNFNRAFRRECGMTPLAYRKRARVPPSLS